MRGDVVAVVLTGSWSWWSGSCSVGGGFGDGDSGGFFVDDGVVGGECGGERMQGEVVDRAGVTAGGVVDQRDRVVGEQGVGAAGDLAVMARCSRRCRRG